MRTSLRHSRCLFMKVGRIEAHRSGERLAMGETTAFPHQRVAVAGGHLDMIAKHGVMADLERSDARLRPLFRPPRRNAPPPTPPHSPPTLDSSPLPPPALPPLPPLPRPTPLHAHSLPPPPH